VRTRHSDLIGDFGRTIRQQQIITQLKTKLATPDTIGKASELLKDLNGAVQTDMQLSQVVNLANFARDVDGNSVEHLTLGPPDYATPNTKGDRPGNYLPICSKVVPAIQRMFNTSASNCMSQAKINTSSQTQNSASTPNASNTAVSGSKQTSTPHGIAKNNLTANTEGNSMDAGVHGLLDVLFAVTFESFDGLRV
jgi:anionic cell wall polymer biosynthesis LytR-Cps2A-Psr (LCP) family protein